MATSKLLAEWFWTDRWMGSSGFLLPMEARGVYREMLTQAWRRGARLPNDHEAIQRAIGATKKEWDRSWPKIERFWRVDGDALVSETQVAVYSEARESHERASNRGKKGAQARAQVGIQAHTQETAQVANRVLLEHKPPSPSPSSDASHPQTRTTARSNRPIFKGNRLVIFDWQLDDLVQILGSYADSFKLDLWFDALDKRALATGEVMPKRDGGRWLQQETLAEARRRGLPIAGESETDPYANFTKAYTCRTCGQVHEGTLEQARTGVCLKVAS